MGAEAWGRRIKAYRKLKGYTQIQFAQELGISVSVLGEVERGSRIPDSALIDQICKTLDIPVEELLATSN
ncbi:helix-turn-helix domain-containing protein (plasmid) [Radiobacillus kanasensis]|uniref:helix-turn-helix domain-containing protein n=1 Tax=Radiobacillus kanasensis TaxID=2844358 RepID=UPI001E49D65A|nr:helix-turn-helix transcriptional regulator [Radiobacillus kanasensis]UFU01497.1 helix-turn-helix domain-containing protein [Radiobacillus kanasensis]